MSRLVVLALLLGCSYSSVGLAADPRDAASPSEVPEIVKKVIAYDKSGKKAEKPYRIGYLTECATNTYCETRLKALQERRRQIRLHLQSFRREL
jgi:hypothetical protein